MLLSLLRSSYLAIVELATNTSNDNQREVSLDDEYKFGEREGDDVGVLMSASGKSPLLHRV